VHTGQARQGRIASADGNQIKYLQRAGNRVAVRAAAQAAAHAARKKLLTLHHARRF
jgi:hypothetical protein